MDECIDCSEPQQPPRQATPAIPPKEGNGAVGKCTKIKKWYNMLINKIGLSDKNAH